MESREKFSLKDFNLSSLKSEARERSDSFQKYVDELAKDNHQIFWNMAESALNSVMKIQDVASEEHKDVISFVSNDYLGMSQRKETIQAGIEGLLKYGTGVCAAPPIGGYLDIHNQLEQEIASFTGQEDALIFSSGFGANTGTLNALLGKEDLAIIDIYVHVSVMDGLRSTNVKRVRHNNLDDIEFILQREQNNYKTKMVIIDGVYSQDGDLGLVPEIKSLCDKYGAILYVDDAHGIGVFGKNGRGAVEHFDLLGKIDIITGTFSKSFGAVGGFVASSKKMIQYLRYYANTTVFSAAVTPQVTCSVLKAIELIKEKPEIREKLWENVNYLRKNLLERGFDIGPSVSPIFPIMIRDDWNVKEITKKLLHEGLYTIGIVYPAVRAKESRIRISVQATHTTEQLDKFIYSLTQFMPNKIQ
ncbi:MAG: aminotransferase class I/II-fold pyridoxal phosphate-dependent enzyme [Dysgonomonas sp.]|nr:aminotransferase class I/II-fold pyridoxal phosphate-dependent enzyme [Dysgonomonas sp.]